MGNIKTYEKLTFLAVVLISFLSLGDRSGFIKLMNDKASQLGMKDTHFVNPTGLDEDSNNSYSTVYDLAVLTRYLIRNYPQVVDISKTEHIYLPKTENHQDYDMYSGINLLTTYPGVVGFKTGYTPEAGLTLITLARKDGHDLPAGRQEIVGVLLGSNDRRDEARELLDYSFSKLGIIIADLRAMGYNSANYVNFTGNMENSRNYWCI